MVADAQKAKIIAFPDLKPAKRSDLLGKEIGTQFDWGQRLFAYYGEGDVFDYGEWDSRDMKVMFSRDGICSAVELVLTLPIREADFTINAGKGDKGESDFVHSVMMTPDQDGGMRTPMHEFIGQVTTAQVYRRSFFEKVFKVRETDNKIVYEKLAYRPPATCQARYNDRTGVPNGFRQQVWLFGGNLMLSSKQKVPGYVDIPKIRAAVYTHGKYREPLTGVSEMEISYWCYQTKMKLLYLWYHFLENQALQRIVVYGNDQPEANTRADDIAALRGSGVVGMERPPDGAKAFEVIASEADSGKFFQDALGFLEGWQTHSVLAGFMALTSSATGGKGSYALSQDQSSFFLKSRQGIAKEMAEWINFEIIRPLVVINFGSQAVIPEFRFGPLQDEQAQALLTLFGQLSAAQVLHIPLPVFDMITERMATILQLDVDQVHTALVSTASQRAEQLAGNPPPGMPPEAAGSLGALQGLASAATSIASNANQQAGAGSPTGAGSSGIGGAGAQKTSLAGSGLPAA
ncbi:MAG: phage portal protein family protein, partial [Streptosporangiaceae bacterium]